MVGIALLAWLLSCYPAPPARPSLVFYAGTSGQMRSGRVSVPHYWGAVARMDPVVGTAHLSSDRMGVADRVVQVKGMRFLSSPCTVRKVAALSRQKPQRQRKGAAAVICVCGCVRLTLYEVGEKEEWYHVTIWVLPLLFLPPHPRGLWVPHQLAPLGLGRLV